MNAITRILRFAWAFYFFFWFLTFFLLFYLFFLYFLASPKRYHKAHTLRRWWGRAIMALSGLRPVTDFETKLVPGMPYIFFANHFSYLDILSLNVQLPCYFRFMAKSELADIPMFKIFFRTIDIPVERNSLKGSVASFGLAGEALKNGDSLGIFPEGGIGNTVPVMRRFKSGAFRLAMDNGVMLVPVTIPDNYRRLPGGGLQSGGTPGIMRMYVHRPLDPRDFASVEELTKTAWSIVQNKFDEVNKPSRMQNKK